MKISIITVSYNAIKYIEKTILSVINQTYPFIEYIVIDGGSTDGTTDIIKKYEDKISYWISEPDKGIYDAMNKGISVATGQWMNFMNAGDYFANNEVLNVLMKRGAFNNANLIYGDVIGRYQIGDRLLKAGDLKNITRTMQFSHQSMFIESSIMKKHKYSMNYKLAADYHFILSIWLEKKTFRYIPMPIAIITADEGETNKHFIQSKREVLNIHQEKGGNYFISYLLYVYYIVRFYTTSNIKRIIPNNLLRFLLKTNNYIEHKN